MTNTYLIVGLGNHDDHYKNHRHNAGYIMIDSICDSLNINNFKKEKNGIYSELKLRGNKFFFLKPETYMNNSGIAVQHFKRFYKIDNKNIIILYDEMDLKSGQCKIKVGGGDNGHNGIKSIDSMCGKDYLKFKIGIGRPTIPEMDISNYVLSDLSKDEIENIKKIGIITSKSIDNFFDKDGQSNLLNLISKNEKIRTQTNSNSNDK